MTQHIWSKLVKERDNYVCQNCGSKDSLHAYHINYQKKTIATVGIQVMELHYAIRAIENYIVTITKNIG